MELFRNQESKPDAFVFYLFRKPKRRLSEGIMISVLPTPLLRHCHNRMRRRAPELLRALQHIAIGEICVGLCKEVLRSLYMFILYQLVLPLRI